MILITSLISIGGFHLQLNSTAISINASREPTRMCCLHALPE
jgi:hypothetical protein